VAVDHVHARWQQFSERRRLAGREFAVEDDGIGVLAPGEFGQFLGFPPPKVVGGVLAPALADSADYLVAGRCCEAADLGRLWSFVRVSCCDDCRRYHVWSGTRVGP